jgi:putative ABC transport system permease protein
VWKANLKSLWARKLRLALTALSIVLGIGFVAGTFVLTDTMNAAFDQLFGQIAKGSDVVVRSVSSFTPEQAGPGGGQTDERKPVPDSLLKTVAAVPGVASASGDVSGFAQMVDPATGKAIGSVGPPTIGANWSGNNPAVTFREGGPPVGPDQVVVDAGTATKYGLTVGEVIAINFVGGQQRFTISGTAGFGDADNLAGATLALFETPTAQKVLDKEGVFDSISVKAAEGVEATALRTSIEQVLPKGVQAVTSTSVADEQSKALKEGLGFFRIALLVFAFIALFVGAFIIFNTFSIIVAQRSKEMALLRAIGASRRQVLSSVIVEALVVGLVASALGLLAGIAIASGLKALLKAFGIDLPSTGLQLEARTILVALIVGTLVTVVSSVVPARRASRIAPIEALRASEDTGESRMRRRLVVGLVVTVLGSAALLYGLFAVPSNAAALIGLGAALTFIGVAILFPLIARPMASVIGAPIRRLGLQGRLGRQNAMRNPRRTASTASALMIGLGLVAMVSILSASLKASFESALSANLRADLIVTTSSFTAFSPDVATKIEGVQGVDAVSQFRQGGFRVNGSTEFMTGVDPATIESVANLEPSPGALAALEQGDVIVYDKTMDDHGWAVGDEIPSQFPADGSVPLTIGGTFGENGIVGGNFVVSLDTYDRFFQPQLDTFVMVKTEPGADPAQVQAGMETVTKSFGNVEVQDQTAYRKTQEGFVNQLLGLITALLAMAILIALFGIVNTLGLSIFERKRELGLLRAVGMGRAQVKRMIRWESVIIAVMGAVLGIAVGVFFGFALQRALAPQGVTELAIPGGQLIFYVVFAGLAGVLAAIWPARRAAKLNILESISYE